MKGWTKLCCQCLFLKRKWSCSVISDSVTAWTVAYQASPSMGFSRQEYRSGLPSPSPGDLPDPGIEPRFPALRADAFPSEAPGKALEEKLWQNRQHIKKQRHYFDSKGPSSQGYGFSSSHVWMWEFDCEESWAPKNWCFWTVVLEKTLENLLDYRRSNLSILKEISPEYSLEGLMLQLKLQYFGHQMRRTDPLEKTLMLGKIEGRRRREQQRMRWLDGITDSMDEFE